MMAPKRRATTCAGLGVDKEAWCDGCRGKRKCVYAAQFKENASRRPPPRGSADDTTPVLAEGPAVEANQEQPVRRSKRPRAQPDTYEPEAGAVRDRAERAKELRAERAGQSKRVTLVGIPEENDAKDVERTAPVDAQTRIKQLEAENEDLRDEVNRLKKKMAQGFGVDSPSTPGMASYTTLDAERDFDEDDDAKADDEMDDERVRRPTRPGRPLNVRVPFDSKNEAEFGESHLRKVLDPKSELVGLLELLCHQTLSLCHASSESPRTGPTYGHRSMYAASAAVLGSWHRSTTPPFRPEIDLPCLVNHLRLFGAFC